MNVYCVPVVSKKRGGSQDFSWLDKYNPSCSGVDEKAEEALADPVSSSYVFYEYYCSYLVKSLFLFK